MTKREKLEELDTQVLDAMTNALKSGNLEELRDLNVCVSYLKNNQVITPKLIDKGMSGNIKDILK